MTPEQIRKLGLQLYTVMVEGEGVAELALWQCCLHACQGWNVEPPTAILISEALTDYLYNGSRPQTPLVTPLAKAQAVAAGLSGEEAGTLVVGVDTLVALGYDTAASAAALEAFEVTVECGPRSSTGSRLAAQIHAV